MPRPRRYGQQLNVHVDSDAYDAMKRILDAREAATGKRPLQADLWREAIALGLAAMEGSDTGLAGGVVARDQNT